MSEVTAEEIDKLKAMLKMLKAAQATQRMQEANRPPTEAEIQRDIARTMADVVTKDTRNPNQLMAPEKTQVAGAQKVERGSGWVEQKPLVTPPGQDAIEALANHFLPHSPGSPLRKGKPKADEDK